MNELTLESLAKRVEALERQIAAQSSASPHKKDWRRVVGIFENSDFAREMIAEMETFQRPSDKLLEKGKPVVA